MPAPADPLTMSGKTRVRNANEYLRVTEGIMRSGLDAAHFPFLAFHSENDTMCDCDGSKQLFLRAKASPSNAFPCAHPSTTNSGL